MRQKGTEEAFSCAWEKNYMGRGTYVCSACRLPLFRSTDKYESGTGWPSYFRPIKPEHIEERQDNSFSTHRTEVLCARCGSHLGHVFDDFSDILQDFSGGRRYCI